jgi:hypothetical protein
MPILDRNAPQESTGTQYEALETDVYEMTIDTCTYEESMFEDDKTGEKPWQYVICWIEPETETKVWQRFNPFYGNTKSGAASRWKAFIDGLAKQGRLPDGPFDPCEVLPGIVQRVSVEKYTKTKGANAGSDGNRVLAVMALKPQRGKVTAKPEADDDADEMPF